MSDLTQSGPTLVLGEINSKLTAAAAAHPLTLANVTLGVPSASPGGSTDNTQITATAVAGQGFSGSVTVTYNRLDIGVMFAGWPKTAAVTGGAANVNARDLLPQLNTTYKLDLQVADIVDGPLGLSTYPSNYNLVMAAGSLVYTGSLLVSVGP